MTTMTAASTRRAVAYRRVSSKPQADEKRSSLETQDGRIREYCERRGLTLVSQFTDVMSGRRDDRKEYQRMVRHLLDGSADVVVVQFLDRFGRNPREILRRVWELQEHNVEVEATDEDVRDELTMLIKAGVAGQESKRTGERVRATMRTSAINGMHFGRPPFGYRATHRPDGAVEYVQDEAEAPAAREMVRLVVEGNLGGNQIADRLNAAGFPARAGVWSSDTVRRILKNEALAGALVYGKRQRKGSPAAELVRVEGYFDPPILTPDEWQALRERMAIRGEHPHDRTNVSDYLLSGILRCGHCGGPMVGKRSYQRRDKKGKYRQYRNYWCSNRQRGAGVCDYYNGHACTKLEAAILGHLAQYDDPERVRAALAERAAIATPAATEDLKRVEAALAELEREFMRDHDRMDRGILDEADFARINATRKERRNTLEAERSALTERVKTAEATDRAVRAVPARVRSFLEDVSAMPVVQAKGQLARILQAAHVYRDGRIELDFRM
jgi:site-specific DNA recombinase